MCSKHRGWGEQNDENRVLRLTSSSLWTNTGKSPLNSAHIFFSFTFHISPTSNITYIDRCILKIVCGTYHRQKSWYLGLRAISVSHRGLLPEADELSMP